MPALHTAVNGTPLCSIGSDDVWQFTASLYADTWGPEHASLTATGGTKRRPDGPSDFLWWLMSHELKTGDRISFSFDDEKTSHPKGERHVEDPNPEAEKIDFFAPVPEGEQARMESRPVLNPGCRWRFNIAGQQEIVAKPDAVRQQLSLHISWNEMRPQRMRISLTKSSLREVFSRSSGESLYEGYVEAGTSVEVLIEG